jgi:replicative DNA helicase
MSVAQIDGGVSLDRQMPQSPDAERAVLGAILINNHAFYRVIGTIDTEDFFRDAHRTIFATMRRMAEHSQDIEPLTLKEELAKHAQLEQIGGVAYVTSLMDVVPDVANVERYAQIVKEKSMLRRLIVMGNSVMRAAFDAPSEPSDVLNIAEKSLYEIAEGATDKGFVSLERITRANMIAIEQIHSNAGRLVTGLPTGYDRFNEMTSGFQPGDLIILAARPSMGKTSLMMNIAETIALPGKDGQPRAGDRLYSVGVFSLEMSKEQIGLRMLSSESGVSNHLIRSGMLSERNWRELAEASARLAKGKIFIDDTPGMDPLEMRAKARRLKMEAGLDLVMVDYLQLMAIKGKIESRQQEVSQISRSLKAIAKELHVPLLSLSQLSRRSEQRGAGEHRPQLSDLRESGSIEQDADLVAFIYRDEVYNKETEEKGIAEIIIAKQRNGPIGDFKLVFRNDITKFFNYEPQPEYLPQ